MDNHVHLLLETPDANLSAAMRDISGDYAQKFNQKHQRSGHLFQGRYKAYLIEKETYFLEVARYIVNNPVHAGMVQAPEEWLWSNFNATSGLSKKPRFLHTATTLQYFSPNRVIAQKQYSRFVQDGIKDPSPYKNIGHSIILGTPQFVHEVWEVADPKDHIKEIRKDQRIIGRPTLNTVFYQIRSKEERNKAIAIARHSCGYSLSEIARFLKLDRSTTSKIASKFKPEIHDSRPDPHP